MSKDYYKILGVNKNASEDDIKKAYRKGAVKWHPDKWSDKSESEKKNAEQKFKELSEANEVLSNPEKRKLYDQFGADWENVANQGGGFDPFSGMSDFFNNGFGGFDSFFGGRQRRQNTPQPGQSIQIPFEIGINEIFNGIKQEFTFTVKGRCTKCHGTGGDSEVCSHCNGTGMITQTQRTAFGIIQNSHPCPYCHGSGKIIKNKCYDCNGTGLKDIQRKIKIELNKFTPNGYTINYPNMGYESKDPNGRNGDVIVIVQYKYDTSKYAIKGNTIYEHINIPYYDCILGTTKKVKLPNNTEEEITIKPYSNEGDQIILSGKGINGNNYIFIIGVEMPKRQLLKGISDKEKKLLKEIKQMHDS